MSTRYSIARRTPALNGLFAGLACAIALTLTVGPAFAQPGDLERVEVRGHMVEAPTRYDVRASCDQAEPQLQKELAATAWRERRDGNVNVRFVVTNGQVEAVSAAGMSITAEQDVRKAVRHLRCTSAPAGTIIYRLQVAFVDPEGWQAFAGTDKRYSVALVEMR